MRFLKLNSEIKQIKKEIEEDLRKIVFLKDSSSKNSRTQLDFSENIRSLISEFFEDSNLSSLIDYLFSFLAERDDEARFEVFNLFCFLSQYQVKSNETQFNLLMDLIDQKEFFEKADVGIKAFGILLNLEKRDLNFRLVIFERLFKFVKLHDSVVLYKYSFDLPNAIGPISRELHLEVLQYGLSISKMKDLWNDFGKLLLIQAQLYTDSEEVSEEFLKRLEENILELVSSLNGIFYLKSLKLNCHLQKIIKGNSIVSNLIESLEKGDCSLLSEENNTTANQEKVNVIKLMRVVEKKCNWELGQLSKEVFGDSENSSTKKIQGLLMKCMKMKLFRAKINRKMNSVVIT
jgi:hypothetical protein